MKYKISEKSVTFATKLIRDELDIAMELKYGENKTPVKTEQQELLGKIKGLIYAKDILEKLLYHHWESIKEIEDTKDEKWESEYDIVKKNPEKYPNHPYNNGFGQSMAYDSGLIDENGCETKEEKR